MAIGVFFDLDDTLVSGSAGLRFARYLYNKKIIRLKSSIIIPSFKVLYYLLKDDAPMYIQYFDELLALLLKGVKQRLIIEHAKKYAILESKNFKPRLLERIEGHKSRGHKLFLISGSPDELVRELSNMLGFTSGLGTKLVVKNGVYTGFVKKPYLTGDDRVSVVKNLAKKYKVSLKDSFAYGNGENDIKILKLVGNPVAINPKDELKPLAKKEGWEIIKC